MSKAQFEAALSAVDWEKLDTAYGPARGIPAALWDLRFADRETALRASHKLWSSLCHQHAYVSRAALPAFPFLLESLIERERAIGVEILDMFLGFARCAVPDLNCEPWIPELRARLEEQLPLVRTFLSNDPDDEASGFAEDILQEFQVDEPDQQ